MTVHVFDLHKMRCRACGDPFPCDHRRKELVAEFLGRPRALRSYLLATAAEVARDTSVNLEAARAQLVDWAPPISDDVDRPVSPPGQHERRPSRLVPVFRL